MKAINVRDPGLLAYRGVVGVLLVGLLWLVITATIAGITRHYQPDAALRYQPFDAMANAQLASRLQLDLRSNADPRELERLARLALQRDPTLAEAARVIGLIETARGHLQPAARAMHYSDRLTRRELATQLWLIEYYVQRNNVPEVLRHFDAAASSSAGATTVLFPVLVNALDDGNLVRPMADMLRRGPWWSDSLLMAMAQGTANTGNVADLFTLLTRWGRTPRADIVAALTPRLIAQGHGDRAARLIADTRPSGQNP